MRLFATTRLPMTSEIWDWYWVDPGNGLDRVRTFYKRTSGLKVRVANRPDRRNVIFYADYPVNKYATFRNVRDEYGTELMPDGIWQVVGVAPDVNSMGFAEGYRMEATLAYFGDFEYQFEEDRPPEAVV